jgi:WD40 repeat protein
VRLWDPLSGVAVGDPLTGHTSWVAAVCVVPGPDGRTLLASASADQTVRLWDPLSGVAVGDPLTGHTGGVTAVCALPLSDGRTLLASASADRAVLAWDLSQAFSKTSSPQQPAETHVPRADDHRLTH